MYASAVGSALDELQPKGLRLLARFLLTASLTVASPFFAFAILFALLGKGLAWVVVPAAMGVVLLVLGVALYAYLVRHVKEVRRAVSRAEAFEASAWDARW